MAYSIDTLPSEKYIQQYAAQYDDIPLEFISQCDKLFEGNENKEFYRGLITGYANAQNLVKQVEENSKSANTLGMIICYISKKYLSL